MVDFQDKAIVARQIFTSLLRLGSPPAAPGSHASIQVVDGSPEGRTRGTPGNVVIDARTGTFWQKSDSTTELTTTGWVQLAPGNTTRLYHEPILKPGSAVNSGSTTAIATNALLLTAFTLNSDGAWQQFKIPNSFVSDPSFHIHWSKTTNSNNAGRNVRWRISYSIFDGISQNGANAPTVAEIEDTYDDASTSATSRIVYRTEDIPIVGFVSGYYMAVEIQAVTPTGTALIGEPGLFSLDLVYREYINQ